MIGDNGYEVTLLIVNVYSVFIILLKFPTLIKGSSVKCVDAYHAMHIALG